MTPGWQPLNDTRWTWRFDFIFCNEQNREAGATGLLSGFRGGNLASISILALFVVLKQLKTRY